MKNYKRKSSTVEAVQWNKHGDHEQIVKSGQGVTFTFTGGYDSRGNYQPGRCPLCKKLAEDHGYILNSKRGGHIVCPGSYVVPGTKPWDTVVYSAEEFNDKYEVVE